MDAETIHAAGKSIEYLIAEYANPIEFAKREMAADKP